MIRTRLFGVTCLLLLFIFACHRKVVPEKQDMKQSAQNVKKELEQLAKQEFQDGYKIIFNKPGTVALVRKSVKPNSRSIYPTIYFFLYDMATAEKIHEDVILNADEVKWISPEEVSVISIPGQVEDPNVIDPRQGYIYSVTKQTKRILGEK